MTTNRWVYICTSTSCGHMEYSMFAPSSTRRCPECGGTMLRHED